MKWHNLKTPLIAVCVGVLFLLPGTGAQTYAQKGQNGKTNKQQKQQQDPQKYRISRQRQRVQKAEMHGIWQQHRAGSWQTDHRSWQQRGGYDGYRISQRTFRGSFGRNHVFRISHRTVVLVEGRPHFQYGDFWFGLMDPWPEYWSNNWYDNDDVYIEYSNDGYYLFNRRHPGIGIAVSVFVN